MDYLNKVSMIVEKNAFFKFCKKWLQILCYFLRQTMGGDGGNIRLIYIRDEQPLVFPQIAKKLMCPMRECAPLSPTRITRIMYTY